MHATNIRAGGFAPRHTKILSGVLLGGALLVLYGWPQAAAAATAAAAKEAAAPADDAIAEIVVTAQRRTERLQDVPLAITALSGADLADRGVRQAADITAAVPNMLLNVPYGPEAQPTFTLRGVTTQDYSQNQSSPIAMYVDEVYKAVGAVQALQTYDLDRVEVLRGPQGTLYGKNATGGAVSFYSRNPSLHEFEGYATLGVGNYSDYSLDAAAGGPLIDNQLGVRAALHYQKRDGWVHSVVPGVEPLNGVDALAARLSFLYQPAENLTASLKLSISRSGGTPYGAHALNVDPVATGFSGAIDWFDNGAKYAVHKKIDSDSAALKIEWLAGEHATLTSVTGFDFGRWYTKSDDGGLPITARLDDPNTYASTTNDFSEEIRLASRDSGAFGWLAGLYYGHESTHATVEYHFFDSYDLGYFAIPDGSPTGIPLYGFDEFNSFDQLKDSKAVFLNTTYQLTPALTLHAGARYTRDEVTISNFYALEGGPLAPGPTGYTPDGGVSTYWTQTIGALPATFSNYQTGTAPQGPLLNLKQSNNNFSYRAGLDWKPSDGVLTYLNISTGYRGAAFNGQAFNFPEEANFANPEKLTSFEVGLKADLWNRRGTFNAALFHYDYRNQQFLDAFTLPGGSGSGFHTVNAPKSRVDGAEFELHAKAGDDVELRAALGLMHSKYVELSLHATSSSRNCCVGNKLIQAPDVNASLGVEWRFARLASGDLRVMVEGNYYGKQYFDAFNTERIAQGAYGLVNARVGYKSSARQGFDAAAWVKNLANQKYIAYGLNQNDPDTGAIGFDYGLVGEPRTYGLEATYRFLNNVQTGEQSLWVATAAPLAPSPPLTGTVRTEVAIIGAGYTGLSAALHLALAGHAAVVIDAAEIGDRASGRNGGQVIAGLKYDPDTLEALYGDRLGPKLVATVAAGPDLVFRLIQQQGIECDAVRNGWLQLATSESALHALQARARQWHQRGAPAEPLSRQEAARLCGSQRYCGGWLDRRGGTVQPLAYVRGLARSVLRAGCRIYGNSPALKLTRSNGSWRIATPQSEITSTQVILATNAYTDELHDPLRRSVIAIPSFQVATAPLPAALRASILPQGQAVSDTWHLLRYFRLDAAGRLVMGSRGLFGQAPLAVAARPHYRAVREIYPQLDGIPFEYHWGGLVAMTPDHVPHLHELAPGLRAALGYNGRGVAMATVLGSLLARWAMGTAADELGYPVTPLHPLPLHRCSQFGARVAIQYLRGLDGLARARDRLLRRSGTA